MAAYEAEATVARAVRSVIAQTRDDWELIVVDDGSTDSTFDRALDAAAGDPRVVVIREENRGAAGARNVAAEHARGELLCMLDSDDAYEPAYLERMGELAGSAPEAGFFSCNGICVNPDGSRVAWLAEDRFKRAHSFSLAQLIRANDVFIMSAVRAEVFRAAGGFDAELPVCEDYDLWLRLLEAGVGHAYTPDRLGVYYRSVGSLSAGSTTVALMTARVLSRLVDRGQLMRGERSVARVRIRSSLGRAELERRRVEHDFEISRRDAFGTVYAFGSPVRRLYARLLVTLSPRHYIRVVSRRRDEQLSALYGAGQAGSDVA
jgi:glycosyltransferase involved in cell wall biosynthesis